MNRLYFTSIAVLLLFTSTSLVAQELLRNPSFEGDPRPSSPPSPWINCNVLSSADTQPGFWDVNIAACDSATYVSIVARGLENKNPLFDGTTERIGQKLIRPVITDKRYLFSMRLMHSDSFKYHTSTIPTQGFGELIKLKVWLGYDGCGSEEQVVFVSPPIDTTPWQPFEIEFIAENNYNYFTIGVDYLEDDSIYFGNILVDSFSLKRIYDSCTVSFPNVFTPNGDDLNADFGMEYDCFIKDYQLKIFNRWGQQIFSSFDPEYRWDGTYLGSPQPPEVYTYYCIYTTIFEEERKSHQKGGNVTILR